MASLTHLAGHVKVWDKRNGRQESNGRERERFLVSFSSPLSHGWVWSTMGWGWSRGGVSWWRSIYACKDARGGRLGAAPFGCKVRNERGQRSEVRYGLGDVREHV